jgi:hypothetical protein
VEGLVSWPQLIFAGGLITASFVAAGWVLLRLTEILVRMETLATKEDLSRTKGDFYARMDLQWKNWQEAHDDLRKRVTRLEIRMGDGRELTGS